MYPNLTAPRKRMAAGRLALLAVPLLIGLARGAHAEVGPVEEYGHRFMEASEAARAAGSPAEIDKGYTFFKGKFTADANDFLARSFGGALLAQTCVYVKDNKKCTDAMSEAIPLLEKGVRDSKKSPDPRARITALRNRAEVYVSLPPFFKKEKIALADADTLIEMTKSIPGSERVKLELRLLRARALGRNGSKAEALKLLAEIEPQIKPDDSRTKAVLERAKHDFQ